MAETKLIPWDLKALIHSHLFGLTTPSGQFEMADLRVVPLELAEVRKTQRRVAALLNLPYNETCICIKRGRLINTDVCYFCSRLNSYRRLGGEKGKGQKCPHVPPAPQNSFMGLEDNIELGGGIKSDRSNLFDTSIFKEGTDPLGFKLPPVFSKDINKPELEKRNDGGAVRPEERKRKKKKIPHSRIVPTVSEKTFVDSNLRDRKRQEDDDYYYGNDYDYEYDEDFDYEEELSSDEPSTSHVHLPRIHSGSNNLVSSGNGNEYDHDDATATSRSEPTYERTMTVDRERTGASLTIDEDYVPMSVFIRQVAERQGSGVAALHEYEDDLSSSISGSLGVSRETSLGESEYSIGDWCTCLDPVSDELPCLECLSPRGHERSCSRKDVSSGKNERQRTCLTCGKLIRPIKPKKRDRPLRRKNGRSINRKDSRYRQTPETAISESYDEIHDRATCSGKKKNGNLVKGSKVSHDPTNSDQHVRFDDQVQTVSPDNGKVLPRTALDYEKIRNYDHAPEISDPKERDSPLFKQRHTVSKPDMRIQNLGVNVHKMAYDLALTDARATGAYLKKKGRKNKMRIGSERPTGTLFSYFPLLKDKRPASEGERPVLDLGVKQDEGRKVTAKNYMKHIFGNIKLADYYPGGKKWRPAN